MRRINLSVPVPVIALVSRYLTNKLIGLGPRKGRQAPEGVPALDRHALWCDGVIGYYL